MIPEESKRKQKEYQLFSDYLLMPLCPYGTKMTRIKRRDRLNFCSTSFSVSLVDHGERERGRERVFKLKMAMSSTINKKK
jgi:hypothetical protein